MKRQTEDILLQFYNFLISVKGYSRHTARSYLSDLKEFADYLEKSGIETPLSKKLSYLHLRRFVALQSSLNKSAKTVARCVASLKCFYRWAKKTGLIDVNPALALNTPKIPSYLPNYLSESETEELFSNIKTDKPNEFRDLILFKVVYGCGLRISEALNLKLQDVDLSSGTIRVIGKGKKERILPLPQKLKEELLFYVTNVRPVLKEGKSDYLFPGRAKKPLSDTAARKNLRKLLLKAGVSARISPHALRHSLATHLLSRGVDIRIVQEILGHSSLNTTQIYTHTDKSWLINTYLKSHPRS